jgi:hypothetical protein
MKILGFEARRSLLASTSFLRLSVSAGNTAPQVNRSSINLADILLNSRNATSGHGVAANATITATALSTITGPGDNEIATNMTRESMVDEQYPGTAVERMVNAQARVAQLVEEGTLLGRSGGNNPPPPNSWEHVRRRLLWAGGLRDLEDARPGEGYTGHAFNDFNHVDLTCMIGLDDLHDGRSIPGIARGNRLGPGIRVASLPDLGPGGSWSTCAMGCHEDPPNDVAHTQFRSRIAFKLVWVPLPSFDEFVLVDDDGQLLAHGSNLLPPLPPLRERQMNYRLVQGSKYAREADRIAFRHRVATE